MLSEKRIPKKKIQGKLGMGYLSHRDKRMNISCDPGMKDRMERLMVYYHAELDARFQGGGVSRLLRWLVANQYDKMRAECLKRSKDMTDEIIARSKVMKRGMGNHTPESAVGMYLTYEKEGKK